MRNLARRKKTLVNFFYKERQEDFEDIKRTNLYNEEFDPGSG